MTPKTNNILSSIKKSAFTLIELLVVMAIIGILIGVTIVGINLGFRGQRNTTRQTDLSDIQAGLTAFYGSHKYYPKNTDLQVITTSNSYLLALDPSDTTKNIITLNQAGAVVVPATTTPATTPDALKNACHNAVPNTGTTSSSWTIGYGTDTNVKPQAYGLCATQEGSDVFDVSAQ